MDYSPKKSPIRRNNKRKSTKTNDPETHQEELANAQASYVEANKTGSNPQEDDDTNTQDVNISSPVKQPVSQEETRVLKEERTDSHSKDKDIVTTTEATATDFAPPQDQTNINSTNAVLACEYKAQTREESEPINQQGIQEEKSTVFGFQDSEREVVQSYRRASEENRDKNTEDAIKVEKYTNEILDCQNSKISQEKAYFANECNMNASPEETRQFANFSIHYNTNPGEQLYVLGDIPELGEWSQRICKMEWSEGNNWRLLFQIPSGRMEFNYKFVCYNENTDTMRWEEGPNRLYSCYTGESGDFLSVWNELAV